MPHIIQSILLAAAALGLAPQEFDDARRSITAGEIRAHLAFLAHDDLRGRAPGTRGGRLAAEYIASRFLGQGLQPVNGSYFQAVPLTGITVDARTVSLALESGDERVAASYAGDAVVWPTSPGNNMRISGEVVFVGHGITAPEWDWDDYEGRDVAGKIVLALIGDPPAPPDEPGLFDGRALTYYGRWTYKLEEARRRGAAGVLLVHSPAPAGYDWNVVRSSWTGEQLRLAGGAGGAELALAGWLTEGYTRRALAAAGVDLAELYARAARRDFAPVPTGLTLRSRMSARERSVATRNVVGLVPGAKPSRRDELLVVTSHYDHLGVGAPVDGDSIYNGAYDNASGVALLLELADAFARLEPGPDRSVLFVATTGEEAGLLGSRHYVAHPLFPRERTVAAINVDGANLWGETEDVIAPGADRSSLGEILAARAREMGLAVRPDPAPEAGAFFRSDHFPFARAGVPVLYIEHGLRFRGRPEGWGEETLGRYQRERYHQPSDEYDPGFELAGAVQQGRLVFGLAHDVANADTAPEWYQDGRPQRSPPAPRR